MTSIPVAVYSCSHDSVAQRALKLDLRHVLLMLMLMLILILILILIQVIIFLLVSLSLQNYNRLWY